MLVATRRFEIRVGTRRRPWRSFAWARVFVGPPRTSVMFGAAILGPWWIAGAFSRDLPVREFLVPPPPAS